MFKHNKTVKITLCIVFLITLISGICVYLLKWNSSYVVSKVKVSSNLVDKMRDVQKQGGTIGLDSKETNEIISMYFKDKKNLGSLTIKGIEAEVFGENIVLNIPVSYKGIDLFVSSKGSLNIKNNKIVYSPQKITVGRITIPKNYVLNKIKSYKKKAMTVEENQICFDKSSIPINVKSLEIKDSKIILLTDKAVNSLDEKLKVLNKKAEENIKNGSKNTENSQVNNKTNDNSSNKQSSSSENATKNKVSTSERDEALERIASGLNSAMGSVSSGAQKSVVSEMISAANSMKGNPNANPYEYGGSARDTYKGLSSQERAELKSAVFSNVNGEDVTIVTSMLQ